MARINQNNPKDIFIENEDIKKAKDALSAKKEVASSEVMKINSSYKILAVDDEVGVLDAVVESLKGMGFTNVKGVTNPEDALKILITDDTFDMLVTDFLMEPYNGEELVRRVREFNPSIYTILLTGYKDMAPPLESIIKLNIQGYCEKSNNFDQLKLWTQAGIKTLEQNKTLRTLYVQTKSQSEEISGLNDKLIKNYYDVIDMLRRVVDAKDTYTRGHSDRVGYISMLIAKELGMNAEEVEKIRLCGIFHDIGKIGIKDSILTKPDKLTDEEYAEIKKHSMIGYELLAGNTMFSDMLLAVRHHHERIDGRGYPDGLSGDEIPLQAKIVAIADAFDAMMSKRTYRDVVGLEETKKELIKNAGSQFDEKLIEVFIKILNENYSSLKEYVAQWEDTHR